MPSQIMKKQHIQTITNKNHGNFIAEGIYTVTGIAKNELASKIIPVTISDKPISDFNPRILPSTV